MTTSISTEPIRVEELAHQSNQHRPSKRATLALSPERCARLLTADACRNMIGCAVLQGLLRGGQLQLVTAGDRRDAARGRLANVRMPTDLRRRDAGSSACAGGRECCWLVASSR